MPYVAKKTALCCLAGGFKLKFRAQWDKDGFKVAQTLTLDTLLEVFDENPNKDILVRRIVKNDQ